MKRPTRSGVEFSSEDSMDDTDNLMNSSIEASEAPNDKCNTYCHIVMFF